MDNKKVFRSLGIVLIIIGIVMMVLSYFYSEVPLRGLPLLWVGGMLIIIGLLFAFVYKSGYLLVPPPARAYMTKRKNEGMEAT